MPRWHQAFESLERELALSRSEVAQLRLHLDAALRNVQWERDRLAECQAQFEAWRTRNAAIRTLRAKLATGELDNLPYKAELEAALAPYDLL